MVGWDMRANVPEFTHRDAEPTDGAFTERTGHAWAF